MAWADEIADGQRDLLSDGAGVIISTLGAKIPAIQGSGISSQELTDGGTVDTETPTFSILKSDLATLAPGKSFKQGTKVKIEGKTLYVMSVSFDPADPSIKIITTGEEQ